MRQACICQTAPSFVFFRVNRATGLPMFWIQYHCVAVTAEAIHVWDGPRLWGGAKPVAIVATLPRQTRLGPVSGPWGQFRLLGDRYWVKRRFHVEISAADAEAGFTDRA